MQVILPLLRRNQSFPNQYVRYINGNPVFEYIVDTYHKILDNVGFQIVTDITMIYERYKEEEEYTCSFLDSAKEKLMGGQYYLFINPSFLFLSRQSIDLMLDYANSLHNVVFKFDNKWVGFWGRIDELALHNFDNKLTIPLKLSDIEKTCLDNQRGWWVAEKELKKKKIVIHPVSSKTLGMGHVYRGLTLANKLAVDHEILFLVGDTQHIAIKMIQKEGYPYQIYKKNNLMYHIEKYKPDIVINDMLNTSKKLVHDLKKLGCRVVNFEDIGEGAEFADAVINALYPGRVPMPHFYTGDKYYCIREDFLNAPKKKVSPEVKEILLTYGGSDPNRLTLKTLIALKEIQPYFGFDIRIILGPAFDHPEIVYNVVAEHHLEKNVTVHETVDNMAYYINKADLIFTSAGRTMYEIATIATPAIVIAQNFRELTHTFGHPYNGFYHLGYHEEVSEADIQKAAEYLINNYEIRQLMHQRMCKIDLTKGIERVIKIILGEAE